ncbi:MAG TPA: cation:proton antiporter [Tepidisphaeraceae bacterium]|nr:cation:proton antiporter [Tepidisphaeraceae bacterium]
MILANSLPLLASGTLLFLPELVALCVAAAAVGYLCQRLGVVPIVGFLLTGVLLGPHSLGLVRNESLIESLAEIGVILVLFTIGMEFSLDRLGSIRRYILIGGTSQVVLTILLAMLVFLPFHVSWRDGLFTGFLVALSSTAIVLKVLTDRHEMDTLPAQTALGILLFQDLAVVVMVMIVPMLGPSSGAGWSIVWALAKSAGIIAIVLVGARRLMPPLLERVAETCSQEVFLLTVVAICLGTAWLTSLAGVSFALGAFLGGLIVSESRFRHHAIGEVMPLQILFSAAFFVSVGLLLDLAFVFEHPLMVLLAILGIVALKLITGSISSLVLGHPVRVAVWCALLLAQVGEFSFVLARTGKDNGLTPEGMGDTGSAAFIAASVVLMLLTPLLISIGARVGRKGQFSMLPANPSDPDEIRDHVIVDGWADAARILARGLKESKIPFVVVTLSPEGAREAEEAGMTVVRGSTSRLPTMRDAGIERAKMLVIADDDAETTERAITIARALRDDLPIFVRIPDASASPTMKEAGAQTVVAGDASRAAALLDDIRKSYQKPGAAMPSGCTHVSEIRDVSPNTNGCEECLKMGDTWVHLRVCKICGHVGCCDSSKNKHATKHFHATKHPIVQSIEPGEDWMWCYVDQVFIV